MGRVGRQSVSGEALLPGSRTTAFSRGLRVASVCAQSRCPFLSSPVELGPALMMSLNFNHLLKGPSSKYSHIGGRASA